MQTDDSPCAKHVRFKKTLAGAPPVRQTSAGHRTWQIGHRLVVRFSNSSLCPNKEPANGCRVCTPLSGGDAARARFPWIQDDIGNGDKSGESDSNARLLKCRYTPRDVNYAHQTF
jgi:hypothetical protein